MNFMHSINNIIYRLLQVFLLEEILSPIVTPFILIFWLRPRALSIVDFLRNHTVEVDGVGDVCAFAQLDVGKRGCPKASLCSQQPYTVVIC